MTSEPDILIPGELSNSVPNINLSRENKDINDNIPENKIKILLNDETYEEISSKSDENYFTKNFDDCMKRLQLIEKEHELIEKDDSDIQFCVLTKEKTNIERTEMNNVNDENCECDSKNTENISSEDETSNIRKGNELKNRRESENKENIDLEKKTKPTEFETSDKEEPKSENWYSNLKKHFENREQENQEQKTKEMTCRITGATLKSQSDSVKSEEQEKNTRHYFSRLVKSNKSLIDEELPDPDKVQNIRAMFQETLNSTLKRKLNNRLGGSLQNINIRPSEQQMSRPLSAQCFRKELLCETDTKFDEEKEKELKGIREGTSEFHVESVKRKLLEKYEKEFKPGKEYKNKRVLQPKWTDSGSVSSGISSDLSSYDTDLECYSREGMEQDEITVSDDDLLEETKDRHYVQNEVLEKIRSFGTSVTYYGGKMITCSVGPILSPTTQAIMEEIAQETSPARSFEEFYRKYVEANEPNRKKKVGRTRSFGQSDLFQKPNVLSNSEIDMYKNDLEIEIGIKKPTGIPQNTLKKKVTKSASLGSSNELEIETNEEVPKPQISERELNLLNTTNKDDFSAQLTANQEFLKTETNSSEEKVEIITPGNNNAEVQDTENDIDLQTQPKRSQNNNIEKESFYLRSKSAPEGLLSEKEKKAEEQEIVNNEILPKNEIYFGYEKSIFKRKLSSDMVFEEFEVCESLSEKLEKIEKINSQEKAEKQEKNNNDTDKIKDTLSENKEQEQISIKAENNTKGECKNEVIEIVTIDRCATNNHAQKKELKRSNSKWPIETSVMVDIQKNNEQTPKIITNGKTVPKTKIRFF